MRNRRAIKYCNFVSTTYEEKDGKKTGRKSVVYTDVKTAYGTVSAPSGSTSQEMFGTDLDYDKTVVFDMPTIDMTENSVLWLDRTYAEGVAHDYIVRKITRNINYMFVACRRVDVSGVTVAPPTPTPDPTPTPSEDDEDGEDNSVTTE